MCDLCKRAYLKRGDIIKVTGVNWGAYSGELLHIRDGSKAIVVPHNEFFFQREKGFFETEEEKVHAMMGQMLYDFVMPNGKVMKNVGWQKEEHFILFWSHREITNLMPLFKEVEDLSQTKTRALSWIVEGNRPPKWQNDGYLM